MTELEKLRTQVEQHDREIQALMDLSVDLFSLLLSTQIAQFPRDEADTLIAQMREASEAKGDGPHTGASLKREVVNRVRDLMQKKVD